MCRYSTALEATGISHTPHCMPIDVAELQDFCRDSGYNVRLERSGTFFTPPSFNVHLTDWERAARLRCLQLYWHPQQRRTTDWSII